MGVFPIKVNIFLCIILLDYSELNKNQPLQVDLGVNASVSLATTRKPTCFTASDTTNRLVYMRHNHLSYV